MTRLRLPRWWPFALALLAALAALPFVLPAQPARGKGSPLPLAPQDPLDERAQALTLANPRVLAETTGHRAEVLVVFPVRGQYTPASAACAEHDCRQVSIYLFDTNTTITAIVDVTAETVLDVLRQPGVQPPANARMYALAVELARRHPDVVAELGRRPPASGVVPMAAGMPGTACDTGHYCMASVWDEGTSLVWAVVDLTDETLVGVVRTAVRGDGAIDSLTFPQSVTCPDPGTVERDDWEVSYETTNTDGFRVYDVSFRDKLVLHNATLPEWHVDYGANGFVDPTGCAGWGFIYPFGETQVLDLMDGPDVIGFEVVQDFRMDEWGNDCRYRYQQHYQFFTDGRFRVVGAAYGRGCHNFGIYRPVMRLDLAIGEQDNDTLAVWDGDAWQVQAEEGWWYQAEPYTPEGFLWRVSDGDRAYFIEPGQGQFGDAGRGDYAWLYATLHKSEEGDTDLGQIGNCCRDDHQQGPDKYVNGEAILGEDLVLWYAAQMMTVEDDETPDYYCWTETVTPTVQTYPCPAGPMFVPRYADFEVNHPVPPDPLPATAIFTNTSAGIGPLDYHWDLGDGTTTTETHPLHDYPGIGVYTVTLTVTDTMQTYSTTRVIGVGWPPAGGFTFERSGPAPRLATLAFTHTITGTEPINLLWDFGDGHTSALPAPTHTYDEDGVYTITLTATSPYGTQTQTATVAVPPYKYYWPYVAKEEE